MNTEQLYKEFSGKLRFFISKRINEQMDIDDILHEVFIKIHNKIDTLKNSDKIESWIFQITRNAIVDYYRKKINNVTSEEEIPSFDNTEDDPHKKIVEGLLTDIEKLPDIYKEAIIQTEYNGLTQKQFAEKLGISLTGAKSRVQRARQMLKNILLDCCHFDFDKYGTIIDYYKNPCCYSSKSVKSQS